MKKIDLKLVAVIVCLTFIVVSNITVSAEPPPGKGKNKNLYPIGIPQTGQTTCYDQDGWVIECTDSGQDGEYQMGVAWPEPRFVDNKDGTVTDNLTGLIWLQDANCITTNYPEFDNISNYSDPGDGMITWQQALDFVAGMNDGTYHLCGAGYTDWRLPNARELFSLADFGVGWDRENPFVNHRSGRCWSSTSRFSGPLQAIEVGDWLRIYFGKS